MGADAERRRGRGRARAPCRAVQRRRALAGSSTPGCEAHVWASPQLWESKGLRVRAASGRHEGLPGVRRVGTRPLPRAPI